MTVNTKQPLKVEKDFVPAPSVNKKSKKCVLVTDLPESCIRCKFSDIDNFHSFCKINECILDKIFSRATCCPLKELTSYDFMYEEDNSTTYKLKVEKEKNNEN